MGDFRIEIEAVGGHGCQREVKDGGRVYGCGLRDCPDCLAMAFAELLRLRGVNVKGGKIVHWPGQPSEVVDEIAPGETWPFVYRMRRGSF